MSPAVPAAAVLATDRDRTPGVAVRLVGEMTVTCLNDGAFPVDLAAIRHVEREAVECLAGPLQSGAALVPINVFLLALPEGLALVDTGAGPLAGPSVGHLPTRLAQLGIRGEDIQHILLTHLHPDHSNGLLDADGKAAFPRARLVLHEREAAFWLDGDIAEALPERTRRNMIAARRATSPYRDRMRRIAEGLVLPGVAAVPLHGHTPGHTGWLLESQGEQLLLWGDIVHFSAVQTSYPDASLIFDVDPDVATATRRRILDFVARNNLAIGGAHLPHPGFGRVIKDFGTFRYEPAGL